ncbi:DUF2567 domain-containing protein [Micromonospora zingiberis]|uniref:DUF2567 domain-containing protein n=1 Tax=Micromonospora zingiberis TaxID=2053011 RepID=A0A4R0GQS7_9ACTN|nr:DUF2567 domain-containing protein [Micromonospora zingiberis]
MSPDTPAVEPPAPASPADPWAFADPPRRPARTVSVGGAVVLVLALLGVPLGLLWAAVAPATPVVKTADGAAYGQTQPEQPVAADGWFTLLGLAFGVLAALALWFVLRRRRGPVGLVVVTAGALAAALVAWQVGRRIGLSTYQRMLETAPDGTAFSKPADLRAGGINLVLGVLPVPYGNLLLPAFGAAVTYTLLAGWSRWPSLRPEPEADLVLPHPAAGYPPGALGPGPAAPWPGGPDADGSRPVAYPPPSSGPWPAVPGGLGSGPAVPGGLSSGPAAAWPAPSAAPEPPAPGAAEPPRG